jgi:hypothetical protein
MPNGGVHQVAFAAAVSEAGSRPTPAIPGTRLALEARARAFLAPHGGTGWEVSTIPFSFAQLGGRSSGAPRSMAEQMAGALAAEEKLTARCLGDHPLYLRDRFGQPAAIATELRLPPEDWSPACLALNYRLLCPADPGWSTAARGRFVVYLRDRAR